MEDYLQISYVGNKGNSTTLTIEKDNEKLAP